MTRIGPTKPSMNAARAIEANPNDVWALFSKGYALPVSPSLRESAALFQKVVEHRNRGVSPRIAISGSMLGWAGRSR